MIVNFRTRGISRDTRKLVRILMLNSKKKIYSNLYCDLFLHVFRFEKTHFTYIARLRLIPTYISI
jgi:hypothetical protein